MPQRPKNPSRITTRPPEALRPLPAVKVPEFTVLATRLRRRRYTDTLGRLGNW